MPATKTLRINRAALDSLREAKGYRTDFSLAIAMGVHPSTVSRVLRPNGHSPSASFLASLADVLDVPLANIIDTEKSAAA